MAMLDMCRNAGLDVAVCYINHGQRQSARQDEKVVQDYCRQHTIALHIRRLKIKKGASEELLRKKRYEELFQVAEKENAHVILTAHHQDDDLETYLFRLLRGSHPQSISGIGSQVKRTFNGFKATIWRPLLGFSKSQLFEYATKQNLQWSEDESNRSSRYARNRIRNELIPLMENLRPRASEKCLDFFRELEKMQPAGTSTNIEGLCSPEGILTKEISFDSAKATLHSLLGDYSHQTTKAHWQSIRKHLEQRQATKTGGGPAKVLQFPGGSKICFRKNRVYYER